MSCIFFFRVKTSTVYTQLPQKKNYDVTIFLLQARTAQKNYTYYTIHRLDPGKH